MTTYFGRSKLKLITFCVPVQQKPTDIRSGRVLASCQVASFPSGQEATIAFDKVVKLHPNRITRLADAYRFQHSSVSQLFQDDGQIETHRHFFPVGFQTTYKPRVAPGKKTTKENEGKICKFFLKCCFTSTSTPATPAMNRENVPLPWPSWVSW